MLRWSVYNHWNHFNDRDDIVGFRVIIVWNTKWYEIYCSRSNFVFEIRNFDRFTAPVVNIFLLLCLLIGSIASIRNAITQYQFNGLHLNRYRNTYLTDSYLYIMRKEWKMNNIAIWYNVFIISILIMYHLCIGSHIKKDIARDRSESFCYTEPFKVVGLPFDKYFFAPSSAT